MSNHLNKKVVSSFLINWLIFEIFLCDAMFLSKKVKSKKPVHWSSCKWNVNWFHLIKKTAKRLIFPKLKSSFQFYDQLRSRKFPLHFLFNALFLSKNQMSNWCTDWVASADWNYTSLIFLLKKVVSVWFFLDRNSVHSFMINWEGPWHFFVQRSVFE